MKKVLIVFPDAWLQYAPTLLNIINTLAPSHQIKVICFDDGAYNNDRVKGLADDIKKIRISKTMKYILRKVGRILWGVKLIDYYKFLRLMAVLAREKVHNKSFDLILGVDAIGYLISRLFYPDPVFLSLEVKQDFFQKCCNVLGIRNLIIQTPERQHYLLGRDNATTKVFYIQNAPIFDRTIIPSGRSERKLIYFGKISRDMHIEKCIRALRLLPSEYTLTLKGIKNEHFHRTLKEENNDLVEANRLLFDYTYEDQGKVVRWLSQYYIGFAFYNFRIIGLNDFNVLSSPSGKVFNYFAAGVPIVGHRILGMKVVEDYEAGLLLNDPTPESICTSVLRIEQEYGVYSSKALRAAKDFDFQKVFHVFMKEIGIHNSVSATH